MTTIRPYGTPDHEDEHGVYYPGLKIGTGLCERTVACLQYCVFREPHTGQPTVGKIHSAWWSKPDQEFQVLMQPFAYVPPKERFLDVADPTELYAQVDLIELPAATVVDRIRTKVCWVPHDLPSASVPNYCHETKEEHRGSDDDEEEEEENDEEEEDEEDRNDVLRAQTFFYRKALDRGESNTERLLSPATPPEFYDLWDSFVNDHSLSETGRRAYWKHPVGKYVLDNFLAAIFTKLAPHADPTQTFLAVETDSYELRCVKEPFDVWRIKWCADDNRTYLFNGDQRTLLRSVQKFLSTLWSKRTETDAATMYRLLLRQKDTAS